MTLPQPLRQLLNRILAVGRLRRANEWPPLPTLGELLTALAAELPAQRTHFHLYDDHSALPGLIARCVSPDALKLPPSETVAATFEPGDVAVLGPRQLPPDRRFGPIASDADALLCLASCEEFQAGLVRCDRLLDDAKERNLHLEAIAYNPVPSAFLPHTARFALLFCRPGSVIARCLPRSVRDTRHEAVARALLTPALAEPFSLRTLASRGELGFHAGLCNPGALHEGNTFLAVASGDSHAWPQLAAGTGKYFSSCEPVLLRLDAAMNPVASSVLTLRSFPDRSAHRVEDFRLFKAADRILCSHSVLSLPGERIRLEKARSSIGLSRLFPDTNELHFLGLPQLDRPRRPIEKNWAFIAREVGLRLIYSPRPWTVFRATPDRPLEFSLEHQSTVALPFLEPSLPARNSAHPVAYKDGFLLHVIHQAFPGKQYVFWGLLLDHATLQPVAMTGRPLLRAGVVPGTGVIYLTSVVVLPDRLHLFCGMNDNASAVLTVSRRALEASWRGLIPPSAA